MEKSNIETFTSESTIHGLKFIGNRKNNKISRFFWTLSLILSSLALIYNVGSAFYRWNYKPDIGINVKQKLLNEIPFPAFTICPPILFKENMVSKQALQDSLWVDKYPDEEFQVMNYTDEQKEYLAASFQWCDTSPSYTETLPNMTKKSIVQLLNETSLEIHEFVPLCKFREKSIDCEKILNRVLTDKSFCFSYNMQHYHAVFNEKIITAEFDSYKWKVRREIEDPNFRIYYEIINVNESVEWTLENGYLTNEMLNVKPIRALKANTFEMISIFHSDSAENQCAQFEESNLIYFHLPNEMPTPLHLYRKIGFNSLKTLTMTAKAFRADDSLRRYSPSERGCFFESERKLRFFKSYTKTLCDYECMTNYTLKVCGCAKFSMPRDEKTPVCGYSKAACHYNAMVNWPDMSSIEDGAYPCNCLPPCNDIQYSIKDENSAPFVGPHVVGVGVIFESFVIEEYESFVAYKLQNFIADCGGFLGLFLGCSVLSIIELFYYCCVHIVRKKMHNSVIMVQSVNNDFNV